MGHKLAKVVLHCSVKLLKYFLYLVGLMFFGLGFDSKAKSRSDLILNWGLFQQGLSQILQ